VGTNAWLVVVVFFWRRVASGLIARVGLCVAAVCVCLCVAGGRGKRR
jgi:hypothetical protein